MVILLIIQDFISFTIKAFYPKILTYSQNKFIQL